MVMDAKTVLQAYRRFVVIGLSEQPEKYSYRIYQRLKQKGYMVQGVSHQLTALMGEKVYQHVTDLDPGPEVAVFVVSPKYGPRYLKECQEAGVDVLWFQPGTYDEAFLVDVRATGIPYYLDCVLRQLPENNQ